MSGFDSLELVRAIKAPFQDISIAPETICHYEEEADTFEVEFESIKYSFGTIDIRSNFDEGEYRGPTSESNWVVKEKLIVGSYPGHENDKENEKLLTKILNCGVTIFACLQQEYDNEIDEELWRNCVGLRPYFKDAEKMITNKELYPSLTTLVTKVSLIHQKIRDCNIIDDNTTLKLAKKLVKAIYDGEVVYLHCWGGHGRAGVIVSIMLHLMFKLSAGDCMYLCQKLHDMREHNLGASSPQTIQQRLQVTRIITKIIMNH
jgi:protein-tyrosine phosphatase